MLTKFHTSLENSYLIVVSSSPFFVVVVVILLDFLRLVAFSESFIENLEFGSLLNYA